MKYMLILRASDEALESFKNVDFAEVVEMMGRYNAQLIDAGVLVAAEGLDDPKDTIVVVASPEEAVEWAKRAPCGPGVKTEIRRVSSIDEFPQDNEWIKKERAWRESTGQK